MEHNAQPHWLRVEPSAKDQNTGLAYACYFALGSGILAPWNAFITAADYFESVFPGRHMDRLFTIAYLPVCLLVLGVMIKYNNLPARPRILTSFAAFSAIMAVMPVIDVFMLAEEGEGHGSALAVVLLTVVLVGILDGMSQGAIFGDAADLPPRYTHAIVGGTASSGVIVCLLRIATKASLPATRAGLRTSTAIYFALSGALCLLCFLVYLAVLPRLGVVRHYKAAAAGGFSKTIELSPQPSLTGGLGDLEGEALVATTAEDEQSLFGEKSGAELSDHHSQLVMRAAADRHGGSGLLAQELHVAAAAATHRGGTVRRARLSWQHVVAEAWHSALALFLLYVVTLSIFPGVLAEDVKSSLLGNWYPIVLITVFNVCDLIGKNIPFCGLEPHPRTLLVCSVLRFLFVPAFLLAGKYAGSVAALMAFLTISLGFSNGLLTALIMTLAPKSVPAGEADLVENIMVFSLVAGLTAGAFGGWLWLV